MFATHFAVIKYLPSLKSVSFTPVGWAKDPELKYSVSFSLSTFQQGWTKWKLAVLGWKEFVDRD